MKYSINDGTLTRIADATRDLTFGESALTPAQMADTLEHTRLGIPAGIHSHMVGRKWVRPEGWPDLDALKAQIPEGETCVYLTYVLSYCSCGEPWIGIYGAGASYTVERGHVENGAFVADSSTTKGSTTIHREELDPANGNVQLWRVRSTGNMTVCKFASKTATQANNPPTMDQPCVERVGKMPHVTHLQGTTSTTAGTISATSPSTNLWTTYHLERDSTDLAGAVSGLNMIGAYRFSLSLQELDMSGWDTSAWTVTSLQSVFQHCPSLRELDLSSWNTSNWAVTNLQHTWNQMFSLERLDVSFDTSNWAVTNMESPLSNLRSLRSIDLSGWDTSKWAVTTFRSVFAQNTSLETLDLSSWDVSNWKVAGSATYVFEDDYSLRELNLDGWDTSGWSPSSTAGNFNSCFNLRKCSYYNFGRTSGGNSSSYTGPGNAGYHLTDFGGVGDTYITHGYRNCPMLTHESLVNILQALPTVTNAPDIQLGNYNLRKLTAEEIAIGTDKGWDVIA